MRFGGTYDDLRGLGAVVTGGASGIGRACALALVESGCHTAILDLPERQEAARETIQLAAETGHEVSYLPADVTDVESMRLAVQQIAERSDPIGILVNSAGRVVRKPALEMTVVDWDSTLDVNLRGAFFCSQAAARVMRHTGGGSIVNIASIFALVGGANRAAYAASVVSHC